MLSTMPPRRVEYRSRNIKITENFYKSIWIPIRLSQISGCGPFLFSRKGIRSSIWSYAAFALETILYAGIIIIIFVYHLETPKMRSDQGIHTVVLNKVSILSTLIVWILGVFKVKEWRGLLKGIVSIDHGLANFDVWVDYGKCVKRNYWMVAALVIQFLPIPFFLVYYHRGYLRIILLIFIPNWVIITLSHCVSAMVFLIYERLQLLNSLLQRLVDPAVNVSVVENKEQQKRLKILCYVCSWHHNIIKLMTLTTETFGLKMVVFFAYAFMIIVMHVFMTCQLFKKEIIWQFLLEYLFAVASYSFTVYKVCNICEYTIREAKKSGLLIHQIETEDFDMRDEIEMFSLQIANENIEFSAAGFFPIDYSLLFSIIGGVTTYIIILIQLDSSDQETKITSNTTAISLLSNFTTNSYASTKI